MERSSSTFRTIIASSVKVGASTVAGLLGWIVGGKILALELGAAGVGIFGLLRQLLQNLTLVSTFNGSTALVQGIASRSGEERERFTRTVARIFAVGGAAVALGLAAGAPWLASWLVPHPDGVALLRWLALAVLATTAQTHFTGLLNAHRAIDALVRCQLLAPVSVILAAYPAARLVRHGQPLGIALLLFVPGALVGVAAWLAARKVGWGRGQGHGFDTRDASQFFKISFVMLISGFLSTGTPFLQNRLVAGELGLEHAGHYWVAWTLSMAYVSILLSSYGTYYMPALSALTDRESRRSLIRDYLRLALFVMPVLVSLVALVKPWVVLLMFNAKLLPALKVMRWMLIGDFFKGISWVLSFPMLAFADMRWFLWTEVTFSLALAGGSWLWLAQGGGIEGLGMMFLALYAIYAVVMWAYVRVKHGFRLHAEELLEFLAGLALVLGVSFVTWSDETVRAAPVLLFVVFSGSFVVFALRRWRRTRRVTGESPPDGGLTP